MQNSLKQLIIYFWNSRNLNKKQISDQKRKFEMSKIIEPSHLGEDLFEMNPVAATISATGSINYQDQQKFSAQTQEDKDDFHCNDLEKKIDSEVLPQKRLFSIFYPRKVPSLPDDSERRYLPFRDWNPFNRLLYLWCFRILKVGYRRTLQPIDCYKLPDDHTVEFMYQEFLVQWEKSVDRKKQRKLKGEKEPRFANISIIWSLFCTFKWTYSYAIMCFIISNVVAAFNPLITKKLVNFVEARNSNSELPINRGVGYTIATVVLMFIGSVAFSQGYSHAFFVGVYSRSILTKALLAKSLRLSPRGKHDFPVSKITTVATTDLSRVEMATSSHPYIWAFPVSLVIALILLITNIGPISLVGVGYFVLSLFVSSFGFRQVLKYRLIANVYTDERVGLIKEILNYLKIIKYYAWEDAYEGMVTERRKKEVKQVKKMQYIQSTVSAHGLLVPTLASLITFLLLFKISPYHSAASIFASLSLFNILSSQMLFIPNCVGNTLNAIIALERVQEVLLADEQDDLEKPKPCENANNAIELHNCSFEWEKFDNMDEDFDLNIPGNTAELFELINEDKNTRKRTSISHGSPKGKTLVETINIEEEPYDLKDKNFSNSRFEGLQHIDLDIKKGEFIVVTGSIGTGKSSLLLALTGLMKQTSGSIKQNGQLLLCGQPWVQNATIRENITFGKAFDADRYAKTIDICSLQTDLENLPAGEFTEIGERGITLSGGQKSRINLARTVYRDVDIYMFDDVLSAVDARVGKYIMEKCILGVLKGKTRILATHQLNLINDADRIIFLGTDGSFSVDTMENLLLQKTEFAKLISNAVASQSNSESESEPESEPDDAGSSKGSNHYENEPSEFEQQERLESLENMPAALQQDEDEEDLEETLLPSKSNTAEMKSKGRLVQQEEKSVNSVDSKIYKTFIAAGMGKRWGLGLCVFALVCAVTTFFALFSSVWLSFWTEDKFSRKREFYMGFYALWNVLFFIFLLIEIITISTTAIVAAQNLHTRAVHNILHAPMAYMDTTPLGRILNRFTKDIDILDNQLPYVSVLMFYIAADIIGVIIMCIIYMPWFAVAIPFLALMYVLIADHYQSSGRELKRLEAVQRSFVYNNFNEVLSGISTIKCYNLENMFLRKNDILTNTQNESCLLYLFLQRWSSVWMVNLVICFAIIMTFLCISKLFKISSSSVGLLLTYVLQLSMTVKELLYESTQMENFMNSVERVVTYTTDLPQEKAYRIPEMKPADNWPQNAQITFENVSLAYRPGLPLVLKNVSIDVKGGEKIGICGRTGAGKSTIMSALYRLVELSTGRVVIDGVDISKIGLYDLRSKLSIIPQEPVLFKGTIRKNLDPFGQCSDDKLWETLVSSGAFTSQELSHIKLQSSCGTDTSELHKFHLDQVVEDDGDNFSLGERQLLTLTRALVRGSKILILDEATSSVDYETDAKIQAKIAEGFAGSTILCIAHRLKTIINYDKILVLDKGEVMEYDTPWNLFVQEESIFREMCLRSGIVDADFSNNSS